MDDVPKANTELMKRLVCVRLRRTGSRCLNAFASALLTGLRAGTTRLPFTITY